MRLLAVVSYFAFFCSGTAVARQGIPIRSVIRTGIWSGWPTRSSTAMAGFTT